MRTKIIVGLVFITALAISAGFFLYRKPAEKTVRENADYVLSAVQLFEEFNRNEGIANTRYLNKVVRVDGIITEVSAVDSVGITLLLESSNPLFGVSCQLPEGFSDKVLKAGQKITVRGLCTGKLMDVVLIKCVIE